MTGKTATTGNHEVPHTVRAAVGCFNVLRGTPDPYPGGAPGAPGADGTGSGTLANTRAYRTGDQILSPSSAPASVQLNTVDYDAAADGSTFFNTGSFAYVSAAEARLCYVHAAVTFEDVANSEPLFVQLMINGSAISTSHRPNVVAAGRLTTVQLAQHVVLPASAVVQVHAYQSTGGVDDITIVGGSDRTFLEIIAMSAV